MAFREACWNVGATRWQTIRAVVLPNSISGILTGVILQVSRAAGETAPIMFTGRGVLQVGRARATSSPTRSTTSAWRCRCTSTRSRPRCPNVKESLPYATAVVLLGSVLLVNATAIALRVFLRGAEAVVSQGERRLVKRIEVQDLRLAYDSKEVLHGISFDVYQQRDPRR